MKKLLFSLVLICLPAVALGGVAGAMPPTLKGFDPTVASGASTGTPVWAPLSVQTGASVSAISPTHAPNDIDTQVTITGSGFAAVLDDTGTVVRTAPTASLGATPLTNVTCVDSTTLTATVPWGMDPGTYDLTVVNPDGGSDTLAGAFTVMQGIGQWNTGDLFGGQMQQLLMKPGDPNTLYASAYGVIGLFRSDDAGEHWAFVTDKASANNNEFAVDPLHPDWLYVVWSQRSHAFAGQRRHLDHLANGQQVAGRARPSGLPAGVRLAVSGRDPPAGLFVSSSWSYVVPDASGALGLIKSTDGGTTWTIVPSLEGETVQDIAFDPNGPLAHGARDLGHEGLHVERLGRHLDPGHDQWPYPEQPRDGRIDHLQSRRLRSVDRRLRDSGGGGIFKSAGHATWRAGQDVSQHPASDLGSSRLPVPARSTSPGPTPTTAARAGTRSAHRPGMATAARARPERSPDGLHRQRRGRRAEDHRLAARTGRTRSRG